MGMAETEVLAHMKALDMDTPFSWIILSGSKMGPMQFLMWEDDMTNRRPGI